jgi:hypothetical protein
LSDALRDVLSDALRDALRDASSDGGIVDCHRVCALKRRDFHCEKVFEAGESLRECSVVRVWRFRRELILEQVYKRTHRRGICDAPAGQQMILGH